MDNYYKGFEGYPEVYIYTLSKGQKEGIKMWEVYFDNIMEKIEPTDGKWVSLAYYYHLYEGWYDESPWEIPDNKGALKQFESVIESEIEGVCKQILTKLIALVKNNISNRIFIEYS
ncbi:MULTISPECIES: dihydroorotate dehydrogenase (quinone) [unclassified Listeria]|uniref:dihydroorotate dehydrogenase (quinone) n=1 Tax=unclassified Listeria TaxID=2642072 RepID=UPI000B58876C|nr:MULTISPECIES: dihydroorotate dehydrogenase (quinone) [unclassified Listeria]